MEILPKALGTRPRLAVEIRWGGVVAARADDASTGVLTAVAKADLPIDAVEPGLRAGNFRVPSDVVSAVRRTLEAVTEKGIGREVTLVVPDSAVRVLLLDFDSLPSKPVEALPVVRFRLKKLLPFEADDAAVSYQIMGGKSDAKSWRSTKRSSVRRVSNLGLCCRAPWLLYPGWARTLRAVPRPRLW
jgi:type IV pilus assembly protein PilM